VLARMWRKGNACVLLLECKLGKPLCKTVWSFLTKLKIELLYDTATALWVLFEENENTNPKRYMQSYVHSALFTISKL